MTSRHETAVLLKSGKLPSEIAGIRERALSTIIQHIRHQLGEGELRPVEVIQAYSGDPGERLDALFNRHLSHSYRAFEKHAMELGYEKEEVLLYYDIRLSGTLRGDVYVFLSDIEVELHRFVQSVLITAYGEKEWWSIGVPLDVRKACVERREEDEDQQLDPYCYTQIKDLSNIIRQRWKHFENVIPAGVVLNKNHLLRKLTDLIKLRNTAMHPVKQKQWSTKELTCIKDLYSFLGSDCQATSTCLRDPYPLAGPRRRRVLHVWDGDQLAPVKEEEGPNRVLVTQVAKWRLAVLQYLDDIDEGLGRRLEESAPQQIGRLSRLGYIPKKIASSMRTVTELKTEEGIEALSTPGSGKIIKAWTDVKEWALTRGKKLCD